MEVDADSAKENVGLADVRFVGTGGCIERDEGDVVALADEFGCLGVVVEATAAVHVGGAGGDLEDPHVKSDPKENDTDLVLFRPLPTHEGVDSLSSAQWRQSNPGRG